jgi:hypothetical protein
MNKRQAIVLILIAAIATIAVTLGLYFKSTIDGGGG